MSKNTLEKTLEKNNCFFENEILPDFQTRWRATLKQQESIPDNYPNRIGMPTINAKSNAGKYFVEFASSSTVHGLNHLVARNRHPVEIVLTAFFVLGALLCLIILSSLFWDRYQNNATVIVVDNNRDEFEILKPALFICPITNVNLTEIPDVFKKHGVEHTPETEEFFVFLGNLTYENIMDTPMFDKVPANKWLEILYDLRKHIPSNVLKENDPYETWVVTERGVCLATRSVFAVYATLNYWKTDNWTIIPEPDKLPSYDYSIDGVQENVHVDHTVLTAIHDPFDLITYNTVMKEMKQKTILGATMSMSKIKTKQNVKDLSVHQRKCKFFNDGGLKTWPVYTTNMCVMECRMKVIQDKCNCRPHFARSIEGVSTCNAMQLRCIGKVTKSLFLSETPPPSCQCVPKCDNISYQIKSSANAEINQIPTNSSHMTLIVQLPQIIYYRSLLYGFTDFLTSVGGAAGLFLGASVLSFVEIFYYGTVHLCFYMKQIIQKRNQYIM
ncbi:pickpocket protein 28-like [Frieseomelitta varia]|uniref:pickpocket protein 28-like n=1 Tax=Frieseomelitta varia TaxID=561572 RepID=UPI001CB69B1B|nr:pickpocket protein 28-like [Frieseomelitta varia]